jgi:hypothetical protein
MLTKQVASGQVKFWMCNWLLLCAAVPLGSSFLNCDLQGLVAVAKRAPLQSMIQNRGGFKRGTLYRWRRVAWIGAVRLNRTYKAVTVQCHNACS